VRTAVVTGGASGIGAATAAWLRAAGVRVVTVDLAPGADRTRRHRPRRRRRPARRPRAGRDPGQQRRHRRPVPPLVELGLDEWRATFRGNVDGTFLTCRAFAPGMVAVGWGRIVNLASI
jgi:NAD(P)-dependent dehydrogenase (short-subunit alcohol dehydrogenase family)